jgi:hypothetical protein
MNNGTGTALPAQPVCRRLSIAWSAPGAEGGDLASADTPRLWSGCRDMIERLRIPVPFDINEFVADLAARRGKRIELMPVEMPPGAPCGALVTTDDAEFVYYAANTSALHADHIALHEIGHLVFGHDGGGDVLAEETQRALLPDLPPELVRRMLGRTGYSDDNERQAEMFASLVLQRATASPSARPMSSAEARVNRFHDLLGR